MRKISALLGLLLLASSWYSVSSQTPSFYNGGLRFNGPVNTQLTNGNLQYFGGSFTAINAKTGPFIAVNTSNFQPVLNAVSPLITGTVKSIVADGSGGYFVGGSFSYNSGFAVYNNLIRVSSGGGVSPVSFISGNYPVNKLLFYSGKLFVATSAGVARISIFTNSQDNWNLGVLSGNANDMKVVGTSLFIGGRFFASGNYRPLVRLNLLTMNYELSWNPNIHSHSISSSFNYAEIRALEVYNNILYFGGNNIYYVQGQIRYNLGAITASTGGVSSLAVQVVGGANVVHSLAVAGTNLFVGGGFSSYRNTNSGSLINKSNLLVINLNFNQVSNAWSPNPNASVSVLKYLNGVLLVGGSFTTISGQYRNYGTMFSNPTSNTPLISNFFTPNSNGYVAAIELVNTTIMVGGSFSQIEYAKRNRVACINIGTGLPNNFAPNIDNGIVYSLANYGSVVLIGGSFSSVEGLPRSNFVSYLSTGSFYPNFHINFNGPVRSMAMYGSSLMAGGDFTYITTPLNGQQVQRSYLANIFLGTSPQTNSSFNANLVSASSLNAVNVVKYINGAIYVGGSFYGPRNKVIMLSPITGAATSFNARINGTLPTNSWVNDIIQVSSSQIAIGGQFNLGFAQNVYNPSGTINYGPGTYGGLAVMDAYNGNLFSRNITYSGEVVQMVKQGPISIEYVDRVGMRSFNYTAGATTGIINVSGSLNTLNYFNNSYCFGGNFSQTNFSYLGFQAYSPPQAPTIPASSFFTTNITYNSMRLNWSNGNGTRRIVLARQLSPVNAMPVNGTSYSFNPYYGSGSDIGGNKVVYDGTGNFVDIYGLSPLTPYYFRVIEYNGSGFTSMYATNFLNGSSATLDFPTPTISASNINFTNVNTNSMVVNFTRGNGNYCLVVAKAGSPVDFVPNNNLTYPTSASFNSIHLGFGNYGIYSGTANSTQVYNLTPGITYFFSVFEYNQNGILVRYRTTGIPSASRATNLLASPPTQNASSMTFQNLSPSTTRVQWVNGNGNKRMLLAHQGTGHAINHYWTGINPGTVFTANSNFSSLTPLASQINVSSIAYTIHNCKVVYSGTGNSAVVSGLLPNTTYLYIVIEFNELSGIPTSANYINSYPFLSGTKQTDPNIVAPSISAQFPTSLENQNAIRLTWANGNGSNRIVVAKQGISPITWVPQNNVNYPGNSNYSAGTDLGSGQKVVYNGPGSSVDVTGLLPYTNCHFAIYEYNTAFNNGTSTMEYAYRTLPCTYAVKTAAPNWPRVAGGSDADASGAVGVDASGNVYTAGIIRGSTAFGLNNLNASGVDIFLAKYSSTGEQLWVKNTGGSGDQAATSLVVDGSGNFYIAGSVKGNSTFDAINVSSIGGTDDGFIAKYNSSGIAQWVQTFGSDSNDMVNAMAIDGQGNILIAGYHSGATTFSGSLQTLTSNGRADFLVAKYSPSGSLIWARGGGSTTYDFAFGVGSDQNNGVYVCGEIQGAATFGSLSPTGYSGASDAVLVRYDVNGTPTYVNRYGNAGDDRALGLDVDGNGNVYMVGSFGTTALFGTTTLTSAGITDGFITKITGSTGSVQWAKSMGGVSQDVASGVDIGTSGDIFVIGSFGSVAFFDSEVLVSMGNLDVFVTTYSPTGVANTAARFGGPLDDAVRGIYAMTNANTYISGYFNAQASFGGFDVYTKVQPVPPNSNWDMFVHNIGATYNSDPSADLVAWYRLNNNANDFSGNNYTGSIVSGSTPNTITPTTDRNNTANSAYTFSGNSRIDFTIPNNPNYNNLDEITAMGWVKVNSFTGSGYVDRYLISPDGATGNSVQLMLTRDQGLFGMVFDASGSAIGAASSLNFVYQQGTWAHVALTYEGGPTKLYLNGAVVGTLNFGSGTVNLSNHSYTLGAMGETIGSVFTYYSLLNGSLDDMRLYKKALSAVQIQSIMNSASSISAPPMENGKQVGNGFTTLLYPNPTNGMVNFEMVIEESCSVGFRIVDLSGSEVFSTDKEVFEAGVIRKQFDLGGLPAGFYTLQVIQDSGMFNHKLILNK